MTTVPLILYDLSEIYICFCFLSRSGTVIVLPLTSLKHQVLFLKIRVPVNIYAFSKWFRYYFVESIAIA